jgi:hypothetical protein
LFDILSLDSTFYFPNADYPSCGIFIWCLTPRHPQLPIWNGVVQFRSGSSTPCSPCSLSYLQVRFVHSSLLPLFLAGWVRHHLVLHWSPFLSSAPALLSVLAGLSLVPRLPQLHIASAPRLRAGQVLCLPVLLTCSLTGWVFTPHLTRHITHSLACRSGSALAIRVCACLPRLCACFSSVLTCRSGSALACLAHLQAHL